MPLAYELAELWKLNNSGDAVRCVAARHPMGLELRYLVNEHPLITRVFDDWESMAGAAEVWRERLESKGWVASIRPNETRH